VAVRTWRVTYFTEVTVALILRASAKATAPAEPILLKLRLRDRERVSHPTRESGRDVKGGWK
jgi:hypothetical protein